MIYGLSASQIDALIDVVRQAGADKILPRFRNLREADIESKAHAKDLVTIADRAAEAAIRRGVAQIIPGAAFVGEEAVAVDPRLVDCIRQSDTCVVVDPIDGTGNFVAGLAVFGTILAVVQNGRTVFGLLYDPLADDWMFALRGEGAQFHRRDGIEVEIHTKRDGDLSTASGFVALEDYDLGDRMALISGFADVFHIRDIRCSCHEYRLLASGNADFLRSYTLKPWDHAAGLLLLEEAGGWSAVEGKSPYAPSLIEGRIVAASCEPMGRRISKLAVGLP